MMPEAALVGPTVNLAIKLVEWFQANISIQAAEHLRATLILERNDVNRLVRRAKYILDNRKGRNLDDLRNLAGKIIKAEVYMDAINFQLKNESKVDITWEQIRDVRRELESLTGSGTCRPRHHEIVGRQGDIRRCLLYLHRFHKDHVLNRKRVTRLCTAHEFSREDGNELPFLQQLAHWIVVIDSILNGDVDEPSHFKIGNAVGEESLQWPETESFRSHGASESPGHIPDGIVFTSFCSLGKPRINPLTIKTQFLLVKILTLRNVNLKNEKYLKNLSLLRYLDLKHTILKTCEWLEGLEELQVLDLRYTTLEIIPHKYLNKMVKLQHLLLGYIPYNEGKRLAGARIVDIDKLETGNLKTLRAVYWSKGIDVGSARNLDDLSVTGLTEKTLKKFWRLLQNCQNLTTLGVAMPKGSITLENCPGQLKENLKRLKMEGQFSIEGLKFLSTFEILVDLTLASPASKASPDLVVSVKQINSIISSIKNLLCLRLYGICDEKVMEFGKEFKKLKKLVIGDMKMVETIKIEQAVIKAVDTLKLCDLPMFRKLVSNAPGEANLKLFCIGEEYSAKNYECAKPLNIFLRGDYKHRPKSSSSRGIKFSKIPGVTIYRYNLDKQCYELKNGDNMS